MEDPVEAEQESRRVLDVALRIGAVDLASAARANLGDAAITRGDRSAAATHYIESLDGYSAIHDDLAQADLIGLISELGIESEPQAAARLLGAAHAEQQQHGVQPTGAIADRVATIRTRLRQALGDDEFDRALIAGSRSTLAEARVDAIALARSSSSTPLRAPAKSVMAPTGGLTARELDVLKLIVEGNTDRQIAEALFITPKTANHHVTRVLSKLECRNPRRRDRNRLPPRTRRSLTARLTETPPSRLPDLTPSSRAGPRELLLPKTRSPSRCLPPTIFIVTKVGSPRRGESRQSTHVRLEFRLLYNPIQPSGSTMGRCRSEDGLSRSVQADSASKPGFPPVGDNACAANAAAIGARQRATIKRVP